MARSSSPDWMSHLPLVLLGIRSSVREDSGTSPAELLYGAVLRLPGQMLPGVGADEPRPSSEFVKNLRDRMRSSVPMPVLYHGHTKPHLPVGLRTATHVFVRVDAVRPPLTRPYEGPFTVLSRSPDLKTFTVDRAGRRWVISVDRLKPAFSLSDPLPPVRLRDAEDDDGVSFHHPVPEEPILEPNNAVVPVPDAPVGLPAFEPGPGPVPAVVDAPVNPPPPPPAFYTRSGRVSRPPERFQAGV